MLLACTRPAASSQPNSNCCRPGRQPPQVPTEGAAGGSLAERFLSAAVPAANRDLWGSLSCTVLVHPATEAAHPAAVQRALDDLQFGSVVVNSWSVTGFITPQVGGDLRAACLPCGSHPCSCACWA